MDQIELAEQLKVYEQRELCVQEELPLCQTACPLGVNVRAMLRKAAGGSFGPAFSEYRKQVIFGEILARICDAPCKNVCARGAGGESVEIGLLERAIAEYGGGKPAPNMFIRPRNAGAVVIGAGLTGLACAFTLSRKGYNVDLYDARALPGGSLREREDLPGDILEVELAAVLGSKFITPHLGERVEALDFGETPVLVATGSGGEAFGVSLSGVDPATLRHSESGVFYAGGVLGLTSPVEKIAAGKRAAAQIERVLKGEPTAVFELSRETKLPFPELPAEGRDAVRPADGDVYTREEAVREAARCPQCECMRCVRGCLLLQSGGLYPKAYISHAQQSLRTLKLMQNKLAPRRTNACNLCGLCKELCPTGVDMEEVYLKSRQIMHRNGELPEAFHSFWLRDMDFSESEAFLCRPEPGREKVKYLFFPGCQMGGSGPHYVTGSYDYLRRKLQGGVGLYLGCCGAPSEWSGRRERTQEAARRFRGEWERLGRPEVILACPTCEKMFSRHHPEVPVRPLLDIFREHGAPDGAARAEGMAVSVFDPCSSRQNPALQTSVRELLRGMGYEIRELKYSGRLAQCCGYGGLIYASNPELWREIVKDRAAAGDLPFVTYCVNCREELATTGKNTTHILDLLFGRKDWDRGVSTLSERRDRRRRLKVELLRDVWGETAMDLREDMELRLSAELAKKLDAELILTDDIRRVIESAERTGERVLTRDGTLVSHLFIDPITYWVEYREADGVYEILNAYTHRMRIQEKEVSNG